MEMSDPHQHMINLMLGVSLVEVTFIVSRNHTTELNTASSNEDKEVGIIKWEVRIDGAEVPVCVGKTAKKYLYGRFIKGGHGCQ